MKKIILLLSIGLLIISCSSENSEEPQNIDLIVGEWKNLNLELIYQNGITETEEYPVHTLNNRIRFENNGNITGIQYEVNGLGDISSIEFSGTWKKLSDDKYSYTLTAINNNQQTNTITPESITFPNTNTMNRKFLNNGQLSYPNLEYFIEVSTRVE